MAKKPLHQSQMEARAARRDYMKAWIQANPDKIKANARKSYLKHHDQRLAKMRARYEALSEEEKREYQRQKYKAGKPAQQAYAERNKEHRKAVKAAWDAANLSRILFNSAKHRALKWNIPFTIQLTDIVIPKRCPVFGMKLERKVGKGGQLHSPTLDRIDNAKGYVPGNVAVISKHANNLKSNGTAAEHQRIAKWMLSPRG